MSSDAQTIDARKVRLSPFERDVILSELWRWTGEDDMLAAPKTREEMAARVAGLQRALDLRDELEGWPNPTTGEIPAARSTLEATVTPELIALLRDVAAELADALEVELRHFERANAGGDRDYWPCHVHSDDWEQMRASHTAQLSRDELSRRAVVDVLARLGEAAVVAS